MTTDADCLLEARDRILNGEWTKGTAFTKDEDGRRRYCLQAMVNKVAQGDDVGSTWQRYRRLSALVREVLWDLRGTRNEVRWNDQFDRTADEVAEVLDEAARRAKETAHDQRR